MSQTLHSEVQTLDAIYLYDIPDLNAANIVWERDMCFRVSFFKAQVQYQIQTNYLLQSFHNMNLLTISIIFKEEIHLTVSPISYLFA